MRVYFVRHGQSVGNATNQHQSLSTPLSELGIQQAHAVANRFTSIPIDLIISSDYIRARQTAEIIAQKINVPLLFESLLREHKKPSEVENQNINDDKVIKIKTQIQEHMEDKKWHYSDEENPSDLLNRAMEFHTKILQRKDDNILIVTHGEILCSILSVMAFGEIITIPLAHKFFKFLRLSNTGITVCEYSEDRWQLITWNDYAHLG